MKQLFDDIDILDIIPQRPPFVMIDKLRGCDMVKTVTTFTVRADNMFCENGRLNACALVENIAQTCAARMGYINQYVLKENVKLGFIGSVKNLKIKRTPMVGELLTTTIEVIEEVMSLTLVSAAIEIGGELIVTSEMKIALSDIDAQGLYEARDTDSIKGN